MSNSSNPPATPSNPPKSGQSKRSLVLFGLLGVMICALAYDYLVARPAVDTAYDKIVEENLRVNANTKEFMTNEDVHKLIGKSPSKSFSDKSGEFVEMFEWPGGLVLKTHKLYAYYQQTAGKHRFVRLSKHVAEDNSEVYAHLSKEKVEQDVRPMGSSGSPGSPPSSSASPPSEDAPNAAPTEGPNAAPTEGPNAAPTEGPNAASTEAPKE